MEDHQLGQHFWNFLTNPKSKASYEEPVVESRIDTHHHDGEAGEVDQDGLKMGFHNNDEGMACDEGIAVWEEVDPHIRNDMAVVDEETTVCNDIDTSFHKECQSQGMKNDYSCIEVPQGIAAYSYASQAGYPYIEVPQGMTAYSCTAQSLPVDSYTEDLSGEDYGRFVKATREGKWSAMKEFLNSHTLTLTSPKFRDEGTALHHTLHLGKDREEIAACLVKRMTADDLEIKDKEGYTPLAIAALHHHPEWLLKLMIEKNSNLPNIGDNNTIPVEVASWKGFKDTTRFLYRLTHKNILSPEYKDSIVGVHLLHHCINMKIYNIATDLVEKFPNILLKPYTEDKVSTYPVHALAKTFIAFPRRWTQKMSGFGVYILDYVCPLTDGSGEEYEEPDNQELVYIDQARAFLQLICRHLSNFDIDTLKKIVGEAMIEAAKHGNIEFITEMLKVDRELISAYNKKGENIFWHAVVNRQEKVFNLIYGVGDQKDTLLSFTNDEKNNILHCAAKLPHSSILDRVLGSPLQMQRELQWFKAVSNVAKTRYRGNVNDKNLTPGQLFSEEHKDLLKSAETSMKDTAKAATTVGALIITTMFAAAFAVIGDNNTITKSNSSFFSELLFNIFVVCDALSLCSSTAAILVFLGILTSSYSKEDFLLRLPRQFMIGFYSVFTAIATMMTSFCCALAIMLNDRPQLVILLVFVFLSIPLTFAMSKIWPLLCINCNSTYGPSIFDKSTKLPKSKREGIGCCY